MQINALKGLKKMAAMYGFDISGTNEMREGLFSGCSDTSEAIKTQNGAAMSIGRISTFLDIYIERDLEAGKITEAEAQELIDHLVMKLRMVKFAKNTFLIISSSRAIRYGQLWKSEVSVLTDVQW